MFSSSAVGSKLPNEIFLARARLGIALLLPLGVLVVPLSPRCLRRWDLGGVCTPGDFPMGELTGGVITMLLPDLVELIVDGVATIFDPAGFMGRDE